MVLPDARRGVSGLNPEIQDSLRVHRETLRPDFSGQDRGSRAGASVNCWRISTAQVLVAWSFDQPRLWKGRGKHHFRYHAVARACRCRCMKSKTRHGKGPQLSLSKVAYRSGYAGIHGLRAMFIEAKHRLSSRGTAPAGVDYRHRSASLRRLSPGGERNQAAGLACVLPSRVHPWRIRPGAWMRPNAQQACMQANSSIC